MELIPLANDAKEQQGRGGSGGEGGEALLEAELGFVNSSFNFRC